MSRLLMSLRGVPDDEVAEVRALLNSYNLEFYEIPPNRWGISGGGIWLKDAESYPYARQLLDEYQRKRSERVRAEYEQMRQSGEVDSFFQRVAREPVQAVVYALLIAALLAFMIVPFIYLALGITQL